MIRDALFVVGAVVFFPIVLVAAFARLLVGAFSVGWGLGDDFIEWLVRE